MADADEGPKTKRSYSVAKIPDGNALVGSVVDFMGQLLAPDSTAPLRADWPLLSPQLDIAQQEDVHESLYTGVKVHYQYSVHACPLPSMSWSSSGPLVIMAHCHQPDLDAVLACFLPATS